MEEVQSHRSPTSKRSDALSLMMFLAIATFFAYFLSALTFSLLIFFESFDTFLLSFFVGLVPFGILF